MQQLKVIKRMIQPAELETLIDLKGSLNSKKRTSTQRQEDAEEFARQTSFG